MIPQGDLTPEQGMARLGLNSRTSFWRSIWKGVEAKVVIVIKHGRTYRLDAASLEAWRDTLKITSTADMRRLTDGRRTA